MYKWSSHSGVDKNGFVDTIQVMLISKKKNSRYVFTLFGTTVS